MDFRWSTESSLLAVEFRAASRPCYGPDSTTCRQETFSGRLQSPTLNWNALKPICAQVPRCLALKKTLPQPMLPDNEWMTSARSCDRYRRTLVNVRERRERDGTARGSRSSQTRAACL